MELELLRPVWITHNNEEKSMPVFHLRLIEKVMKSSTRLSLFLALQVRIPGRLMHHDTPKGLQGTYLRTCYFTSNALDEEKYIWKAGPFLPSEAAFKQTAQLRSQKKSRDVTI